MATGVQPRDEDSKLTRAELEAIQDAMKSKKFRDLLSDYCEEVRDPANQAIYQKEMTQLEKERGYDVTFINPKGGYVIKTSVAGDRKAFINICSSITVDKPSCKVQEMNGQKGMNWLLPYSIIPPREDIDSKKRRCVIYDVVFHPDTLRMAEVNKRFRELVNKTAFDGLQKTYDIHFDNNNCRFPKSFYKGMATPAVIRKEDPNFVPNDEDQETEGLSPEALEKLYPQHVYEKGDKPIEENLENLHKQHRKKVKKSKDFVHSSENGYSVPKYQVKQQKNVDLQDYTYHKDSKHYSAVPSQLVVEINMPLLSSTSDCILDVREKSLNLISEKPAKYKLDLTLPYAVDDERGSAKFDKTKHMLIVTLPVIRQSFIHETPRIRSDSGIDSENNSFDEEEPVTGFIEEIASVNEEQNEPTILSNDSQEKNDDFLLSSIGYSLPSYTFNALDNIVAFTFHVKNTEPDSVIVKNEDKKIIIKFSTLGSGFVPLHYAAIIIFEEDVVYENISGEAWDNNVILQLELKGNIPESFRIGLNENDMKQEHFDLTQTNKILESEVLTNNLSQECTAPIVEVTNLGSETNIVVSSKSEIENDEETENDIVWTESNSESGAKSILRKPISMMRSFSESSACDVASSMDYISSDCIPEESSYKKTVRFNDVIARQFYRYNSSIEGQKRKNQRKKSKKRSLERRKSESEAEDDTSNAIQTYKPRLKSVLKQRHDSGLADTSDAEVESRNTISDSDVPNEENKYVKYDKNREDIANKDSTSMLLDTDDETTQPALWKSLDIGYSEKKSKKEDYKGVTCNNIKHNTDLYNPDRLNKGQYPEVMFKNDLIFDLDM